MKFKPTIIASILMVILFIATACNSNVSKGDNHSIIKGVNYAKVMEQGLQSHQLSLKNVLYEETISEGKMIFFTSHNALGVAYMEKDKDGWIFNRITPLYDFQSTSNPPPLFMAGGTELETPTGIKYFLAMGKIFNPSITKVTLSNDSINAIIKEKDRNIFWFQLLENKDLDQDIKVYDKDNNQLN